MPSTQLDYPSQLMRAPVIDVRRYGAKGDGINNDTGAIQTALDAAATVGNITTPATVFIPRGKYRVTTALKFRQDGIILLGEGMMGFGTANAVSSILVADASHDATPVIQVHSSDRTSGSGAYRGTAIKNISFDLTGSSAFVSALSPPPVVSFRGVSNSPSTEDLWIFGSSGTSIFIGPDTANGIISENLKIVNCYCLGGFNASGGPSGQSPKGPGVVIAGADNIQLLGGYCNYYYSSIPPATTNTLSDVPAIQVIPADLVGGGGGVNLCNNGTIIDGMAIANYIVAIRLSSLNYHGQWYGLQYVRISRCVVEGFNKFVQINQENTLSDYGYWRTQGLVIEHCELGGTAGWFGTSPHSVQASNLRGGRIDLAFLNFTGDLQLDQYCTGVAYRIGANPSSAFYSASDAGTNWGFYTKDGLLGGLMTGQTRMLGSFDPASANSGSVPPADLPLQVYGKMVKLWNFSNTIPSTTGAAGQFGEMCLGLDGSTWYVYVCIQSGVSGAAQWGRMPLLPF